MNSPINEENNDNIEYYTQEEVQREKDRANGYRFMLRTTIAALALWWVLKKTVFSHENTIELKHDPEAVVWHPDSSQVKEPDVAYLDSLPSYALDSNVREIPLRRQFIWKEIDSIKYKKTSIAIDKPTLDYLHSEKIYFFPRNTHQQVADSMIGYIEKDYAKTKHIIQKISTDIVGIKPTDSYTERIYKIQQFVWNIPYQNDIVALSPHGKMITDYQLPGVIIVMSNAWDCNNKTWLFLQLCKANGILSAIGISPWHAFPLVGYKSHDIWDLNVHIGDYYYIPMEATAKSRPMWMADDIHMKIQAIQTTAPDKQAK